ncbi:Chaperone protein DnaJ [BD1-7 clade bacterium]|uniref:Chaperone protein DnaJ n=1 Tax=BD1-7 clade bacterium TaxID=2029982 RepID=A0A5S9N577_9GAMM|nr:Chaperone protein DnaJ [BD1-7 clade bacterium]CAA0084979.1 Chaperone protein DnaJ [BD1-7 clade bacterium]
MPTTSFRNTVDVGENPLVMPVLAALQAADKPLAIHELMAAIKAQHTLPTLDADLQVALFQMNWLLMNALYQLQHNLLSEGYYLAIQTLHIELQSLSADASVADGQALKSDRLRDYYLDWQHFNGTTKADVDALLRGVWQQFTGRDQQADALAVLSLDEDADWATIRTRYRQLAARHHPDRGGDAQAFMRVRQAYECLQQARR